jgi:excisionase family DNA binding protein
MVDRDRLLLKPEEVAERLAVSRAVIYRMMEDGRLPTVTIPDVRGTFVRVSDLNAWVRALVKQSAEAVQ